LDQTDKRSDVLRTHFSRDETKKEIIRKRIHTADKIVFDDAKFFFKDRNIPFQEKIVEGEFSTVVKNVIERQHHDLILMSFRKDCLLNYRLLEEVDTSIWIESKKQDQSILAVCSNLAPNQKVPQVSMKLAQLLGWDLHMLYVVDVLDNVVVDAAGRRSERKSTDELIAKGERFVNTMTKKGINTHMVTGGLERETAKAAKQIGANLIIVGREKKKHILGLPVVKSTKRKLAEKCKYSILFVN
jgi:hypothetical protein